MRDNSTSILDFLKKAQWIMNSWIFPSPPPNGTAWSIPLESETWPGRPWSPLLSNIVLGILANPVRLQKYRDTQIGKEVKLSLFADNIYVYNCINRKP